MKRKILAILLMMAMILTMIPATAFADEAANEDAALTEQVSESAQETFDEQAVETEFAEIELQVEETEYETEAESEDETETDEVELLVSSYNGINAPFDGTFDCIWFGEYPQAEVVAAKADMTYAVGEEYLDAKDYIIDSTLYKQLVSASWNDNNDTTIGSSRYHRIRQSDAPFSITGREYYYNWKNSTTYHYFKYQPIKWRVLSIAVDGTGSAIVMADKCLDTQRYHDAYANVTWETSDIRNWLNSTFMNMAFSPASQAAIIPYTIANANNTEYDTYGGNDTTDKIYLLSEANIYNTSYGFSNSYSTPDAARMAKSSAYAKSQGIFWHAADYKGKSYWWLRSPGNFDDAAVYMSFDGTVIRGGSSVATDSIGIRPALVVNLSSSSPYTYAGTVSSNGTVNEVASWEKDLVKQLPAVTNLRATSQLSGVKLTWSPVAGADGYLIYGFHGSPNKGTKYEYIGMTAGTSYLDSKALTSDYNYYFVFPYYYKDGKMIPGIPAPYVYAKKLEQKKLPAVTNLKAASLVGSVKLTWSPVSGAKGYLIYGFHGSPNNGAKYTYIGMTTKGTTFTDTKALKSDFNFYYVFAYKLDATGKMIPGQTAPYVYAKAR